MRGYTSNNNQEHPIKKHVEIVAKLLAVAFLVALLASTLSRVGYPSAVSVSYAVMAFVAVGLRVACGWWLYQKTKRKQQYPWLWCLLGCVFGLMAIAVYFLIEIYRKVSLLEERGPATEGGKDEKVSRHENHS